MDKEQALLEYGDVPLKFKSYYKYCFTFEGCKNGNTIRMEIGGNSDDIYRFYVDANMPMTIKNNPDYNFVSIRSAENTLIWQE